MKKSAILQILNNESGEFELIECKTEKYLNLVDEQSQIYNALKETVPPEHLELIDKMMGVLNKTSMEELDGYYREGFKLGLRLGMETFFEEQ